MKLVNKFGLRRTKNVWNLKVFVDTADCQWIKCEYILGELRTELNSAEPATFCGVGKNWTGNSTPKKATQLKKGNKLQNMKQY